MEHYVTLFNTVFIPQGLALHMSLERHAGPYTLWILCMDDATHETLSRMPLPHVRLLQLSRLETPDLLRIKPTRSPVEYCWTLTPFTPRFVFEEDPTVNRVTYVDADLWFRRNPRPLFRELENSGKQVMITDHGFAPENDMSEITGQYCVQFMPFTRRGGERVRKWWEERCVEWCFSKAEDGKLGDQKYLDVWPELFPEDVHVLANKELTQAPWNATRFPYSSAVFWHFHSLRILSSSSEPLRVDLGHYPLPAPTKVQVYDRYLVDLGAAVEYMRSFGLTFEPQARHTLLDKIKRWRYQLYRTLRGSIPYT